MLDFETFQAVLALYADYAAVLDSGNWDKWPGFFTEDCSYKLQPRENHERNLPLATLSFESRGMLKDRVYGISETIFHDPYYQRHIVSIPRIVRSDAQRIETEANYVVFRTKPDGMTTPFNAGRYLDVIRRTVDGLKFESKLCVFDSEMIPNSIIYPI
ncbi:salicylate hydroxylase [Paraburkholderia sp. NMBU_R16]|uniref:aromatic-ring-hydroxylating dioxygenase subunit beta n=1 Tax=Paraburkholderia sp. NMBU_R16 TaxID=2698676 RepID=UPI0015661F19|nr:aromatic-ring-hydroxylating dioxygenase subunit beta [Paraburkholderia sp. NMBU_R16]NRO96224.1 salicylate hydroxylase [Paraburkholderia sp. NMBU_R16]